MVHFPINNLLHKFHIQNVPPKICPLTQGLATIGPLEKYPNTLHKVTPSKCLATKYSTTCYPPTNMIYLYYLNFYFLIEKTNK